MNFQLPTGGSVRGVGTDLVECARIERVLERQGERFLKRIYTTNEQAYCLAMKNPVPHLAARFAAKEAVSKCFTTGIGEALGWRSIEVLKGDREEPLICLDSKGVELMKKLGVSEVLISLSHTREYGVAFAVLVGAVPVTPMITMNLFYPIFSVEEARAYEKSVLGENDASIRQAMENAGRAIGNALYEDYLELGKWPESPHLLVLCGKGLNTGDALIACQVLHQRVKGLRVRLVQTCADEGAFPLVTNALNCLRAMMGELLQSLDVAAYLSGPSIPDEIVLDGLYGMGFKPPLREEPSQLLKQVNQREDLALRVSIDLPSGMGANGCDENTFVADFTYIPGVAKKPVLERANRQFSGRIRFLEVDPFCKQTVAEDTPLLLGSPKAYKVLPRLRSSDSDKRKFGHCLVVAGSADMPGAAVMNSLGALHAGAGLVTVLCPASVSARVAGVVPEAMWRALPLSPEGGLDVESVRVVSQVANKADALLIGPGLVMDRSTTFTICRIIRETPLPLVLDASALTQDVMTAVLGRQFSSGPVIITPHQGEYARILGAREATDDPQSLIDVSRKFRVTAILKGHPTYISDGHRLYCLPVGGPVLARGGSGDILAGILTTLLAQNKEDPLKAALMAVSWHGAAADSLAREKGNLALRTTDLLDHLCKALRD